MEFVGVDGLSVHVPDAADGQRLQRFASATFREELGRGGGRLHGACKHAAHQCIFLVTALLMESPRQMCWKEAPEGCSHPELEGTGDSPFLSSREASRFANSYRSCFLSWFR